MQASVLASTPNYQLVQARPQQAKWQRILLLFVLGYEGAGALAGGFMLIIAPDGNLMSMPVEILHGSFPDFLVPGIILSGMGVMTTVAFFAVLQRAHLDWLVASASLIGLLIWFWIEIAILLQLHWLHAMWGLPVVAGVLAAWPLVPEAYRRKGLLYCGVLSSLLYVVINIIVPMQWEDYNSASQVVSELSAIGAPTRILWSVLAAPYTLLMLAFGWGVYKASSQNIKLQTAGKLLIAYAALGILWPFAPMHLRQTLAAGGSSFSDTMHLALGAITQLLYLLALMMAGKALSKSFQLYSLITFLLLLIFGALTFWEAPGIASGKPTPFIGLWERLNIGLFLLWIAALAIILLRAERDKILMVAQQLSPIAWEELPGNGEEA